MRVSIAKLQGKKEDHDTVHSTDSLPQTMQKKVNSR